MAKNKKISDFQQALKSNTRFLNQNQQSESNTSENSKKKQSRISIDSHVASRFKALAQKHQVPQRELIEVALKHFLALEDRFFQEK